MKLVLLMYLQEDQECFNRLVSELGVHHHGGPAR